VVVRVAFAQTGSIDTPFDADTLGPPPPAVPALTVPSLRFRVEAELPLPGPLADPGPRIVDGRLTIPVGGGAARAVWTGGDAAPRIEPVAGGDVALEAGPDEPAAGYAPDGGFRVRALPRGRLVAERRCPRCRGGWNRVWRLRVPGSDFAPPLVTGRTVYFGATDNRVYAVRRRNGHRLWDVDVGGRVLRPLVLWQGHVPAAPEPGVAPEVIELLLVVPWDGAAVLALEARTGHVAATFEAGEDRTLVGAPVSLDDGRVAVARQSYDASEAALLVLAFAAAPSPTLPGALSEAAPAPAPDGPRVRPGPGSR